MGHTVAAHSGRPVNCRELRAYADEKQHQREDPPDDAIDPSDRSYPDG